ncbi:MAG: SDR family oxidoreductase [Pleurocapsa sp. MO_226.B13]|nr:SDR family oxidoreductase [Pleurocapsa sp. MO_226.B13]
MQIFVAGATGQTGRHIVRQAIEKDLPVKALVRDLEQAKSILPSSAELILGDVLKPATFEQHLSDCDVLLCATGATPSLDPTGPYQVDYQGTKNLVDAAKASGVKHFILVSSLCVSKFFHPLNLFWLILYWKKQAESYLQASGLDYTIVRPGGLKNEDNSEPIVMKGADILFDGSIPRSKVACVCVEAIFQPEAKSKIVEIITTPEAESQTWEQLFSNIA